MVVIEARQSRTDQLPVGKILLVAGLVGGGNGIDCFLHRGAYPRTRIRADRILEGPENEFTKAWNFT
jgi:hypothetical protein